MDFTGISQDVEGFSANSQDFDEFPAISSQLPEMGGRGGGLNARENGPAGLCLGGRDQQPSGIYRHISIIY